MAFTVTGGKYALQTLTAVGTNTVTVNSAVPFVVADFSSIQRIACLYAPAGPDLIVNGDFATDTAWTKDASVTIAGGAANATGSSSIVSQNVSLVIGQLYTVTVQYTRTAGANLRFCNSMTNATNIVATLATVNTATLTTLRFSFIAVSNGFKIEADGAVFTGTIDNVTLSIGVALKGIAYVRRATSTTAIELETPFYDHATGVIATQAVGDRLLISKNWAECVTAGFGLANNLASLTDYATFGIAGDEAGCCIYDEGKLMYSGLGTTTAPPGILLGGVWMQGHLQDWTTGQMYGGCDFLHITTSANTEGGIQPRDLSAHYIVYAGKRTAVNAVVIWEPAHQANTICRAKTLIWRNVDVQAGVLAPGDGTAWFPGTESRMQFINCLSTVTTGFNVAWRPGNAVVTGGAAKIVGNNALSVFGSAYNGFAISAPSGQRFIVSDVRSGGFWDQFYATSATANFTNVLTPVTTVARPNGSATATFNWYFRSAYQNLDIGSLIQILKADGTTTETSVTTTTTNTDLTVLARTHSGAGTANPPQTYNNASWTYAIWKYGSVPISGSFAQSAYSLGTAGSSLDVVHGAFFNQLVDSDITQTNSATVAAYTVLSDLGRVYDYSMYDKGLNITNMKWLGIANQTFTVSGVSLVYANNIVIDSMAASLYSPNTTTNVLTIKASTLATSSKFTTLQAAAIQVNASTTVSANLVGAVTSAGTLSGAIVGNVINTGTIDGADITGTVTQAIPTALTGASVSLDVEYNTNTPITIVYDATTVTGTVRNLGTGLVTITLANGSTIGTVGTNVTTQRFANVTAPNIIVGSRVQLYDMTNNVELYNAVLSSALNYQHTYVGNITVRMRVTYQSGTTAKLPVEATGLVTTAGLQFLNSQTDDAVYILNAIDGSTCTEYTPDYPNVQIDIAGGSTTSVQRLYNWSTYIETTADGIRVLFHSITAIDEVNYLIDQSVLDVKLDNTGTTPVKVTGGVISRKDGTTVIAATSGSIQIDPAKAYLADSSGISSSLSQLNANVLTTGKFLALK